MLVVAGVAVVAYLLGTFPTAAVVGRREGTDPTREGSGNPGASNVYRLAGARAGAVVLLGDALKGIAAAGAGHVAGGRGSAIACGAAAVAGHCYPITRRGRGGKGVATAAGMTVVAAPLAAAVALAFWVVVAAASRKASAASLAAIIAVPVAFAATGGRWFEIAGLAAVSLVVVARHRGNIARLLRGEERSLRAGRTAA